MRIYVKNLAVPEKIKAWLKNQNSKSTSGNDDTGRGFSPNYVKHHYTDTSSSGSSEDSGDSDEAARLFGPGAVSRPGRPTQKPSTTKKPKITILNEHWTSKKPSGGDDANRGFNPIYNYLSHYYTEMGPLSNEDDNNNNNNNNNKHNNNNHHKHKPTIIHHNFFFNKEHYYYYDDD